MITLLRAAEAKLIERLGELEASPHGWTLVYFHLDNLLEQYKSDFQVRIAVNLIHDLLRSYDGGVYVLSDGSIGVLCRDLTSALRNKLIFQLRYLYMDDPVAYEADGNENPAFCTVYDLRDQLEECSKLFSRRLTMITRGRDTQSPGAIARQIEASAASPAPLQDLSQNFSAIRLANVEQDLQRADIASTIRKQAVCAVAGSGFRHVFDECYINIAHLRELLKVDVDFLSNKWLFKYLTQILDKRVLSMMQNNQAEFLQQPISININLETLLSDEFNEFDAALKPATKVSIVFEVHVVDAFADMAAFTYARENVQRLGYRVCLDGLSDASFLQVNRSRLGVDLIKLQWNAEFSSDLQKAKNMELADAVRSCGANRIILCRCDNKEAVEYGQALGISLFQGRYVDSVLNPAASVKN